MLPVVDPDGKRTFREILLTAALLVPVSMLPAVTGLAGPHYFFGALVLGIFVAYMVLGTQFNSFIHPVTILLALPFSVTGAFIALKLTHQTLNIYSMIGLILLMGIVKKNSILLVDFTNLVRAEGPRGWHGSVRHFQPRFRSAAGGAPD